jgi:four helix bundle protein
MATIKKFEELEIWIFAREAENYIYQLTLNEKFKRDFSLVDQIRRASGSVMDNIAEGFGRGSRLEFAKALGIAIGEANEVQSQLYRALDRKYINNEELEKGYNLMLAIINKTGNFIQYPNRTDKKGIRFSGRD